MKLVSFEIGQEKGYGALIGDHVARLDTLVGAAPDLKGALAAWDGHWPDLPAQGEIPLADVKLLPPVHNPDKIICVATNFREWAVGDKSEPEYPLVFTRFAETLTGHNRPLIKPSVSSKLDFEGELAVVIGRRAHQILREDAMSYVAGYCCFNDGSVRDWQKHSTQFTPGKNFYRSGAMGPWMVTANDVTDVSTLSLRTRVNGAVKQEIAMARMIFDIPWLISYFSTFIPLMPGDILATGTPSGFGSTRTPPEFLQAGDRIDVEIDGIGTLTNIVRDA